MPAYGGTEKTASGQTVSFFHDSSDCIDKDGHKWDGWENFYDYCDHEGDDHSECNPSGGQAVCSKCGMGAMHHSLMMGEE